MLTVETIKLMPPARDYCGPPLFFNIGYDPRFLWREGLRSLSYPIAPLIAFRENPCEATFSAMHSDLQDYCCHAVWVAHEEIPQLDIGKKTLYEDFSIALKIKNHEGTHLIDQLIHMLEGKPLPETPSIEQRIFSSFTKSVSELPEKASGDIVYPPPSINCYEIATVPPELYVKGWRTLGSLFFISPEYPEWMIEPSQDSLAMIEAIRNLEEPDLILPTQRYVSYQGMYRVMTSRFHILPFQESIRSLHPKEIEKIALLLKRIIIHTGFSPSIFSDALGILGEKLVIRGGSSPTRDTRATLRKAARELECLSPVFHFIRPRFSIEATPPIRTDTDPGLPTPKDLALCKKARIVHISYEYGATSVAGLGVAVTGLTTELTEHIAHQTILCPSFPFAPENEPGVVRIGTFHEITDRRVMYAGLTEEGISEFSNKTKDWIEAHRDEYDVAIFHDYHGIKELPSLSKEMTKIAVIHNHLHWGDLIRRTLPIVDATICVSPQFALEAQTAFGHGHQAYFQTTPQLFGIENGANMISHVWNGIDLSTKSKEELLVIANTYLEANGYPPIPEGKKIILAVQRYDTYQKWLSAFEAVQAVVEERDDAFFISLGISEDPEASLILDALETRPNNLITRGHIGVEESQVIQKAIGPVLRHLADLTVILSRAEMGGLVVHEANSCGSAVIATRTGGLMNSVKEGENGFLVDMNLPAVKAGIHRGLDTPWDRAYLMERPQNHTWKHQIYPYLAAIAKSIRHHNS